MDTLFSFGTWLRLRRSALLIPRTMLAEQVGCAEVTLRKLEADERRPSQELATRLARLLGLSDAEQSLFIQVARGLVGVDYLPNPIPCVNNVTTPVSIFPSGTVTFLVTDIVGSTRLWEQQPQAMSIAHARHDTILRQAITHHNGLVVKSGGDSVLAVFVVARDCIVAVLEAQRGLTVEKWNTTDPLQIRMAMNTGVGEIRAGDYYGSAVNRTFRLVELSHPRQVLLSRATAELVQDELPLGASLHYLGEYLLKDLNRPEHIFHLVVPDLPTQFPPVLV